MTSLACLFGIHSESDVTYVEARDGAMVVVVVVVCARCGVRISEEVHPIGQLPASGDGAL